jgi:flagellar biosynthesis/type III secretory pathway protein FliH
MPLLKAQQVSGGRESPIVMDLADLEQQAGQIIARAKAQAAKLLADARAEGQREIVRMREEARAAGHNDGMKEGLAQGRQQGQAEALAQTQQVLRELSARWSQTLELLHQHMPTHIADAKTDLVRLALAIAERITRQEALRNRHVAPALVEETLKMVGAARKVAVHVSALEVDLLQTYIPEVHARLQAIESVEIVIDEEVGPGGCMLQFGAGQIDARIETQLARISQELLGEEAEGPAGGMESAEGESRGGGAS